jgi:uncharacterized protein YjiK
LAVGAVLAPAAAAADSEIASAMVTAVTVVPGSERGAKQRIRELSGLEWDARSQVLLAVSDRGWLYTFQVDAIPPAVRVIARRELGEQRVDAESLCLDSASQMHVVDEKSAQVLHWGAAGGVVVARSALPEPLSTLAVRQKANSGVEALACHARYGIVAAPQRALDGNGAVHHLYASSGRQWAFLADSAGASTIKAFHLIDDRRLLVLEKVATDPLHRTVLRELNPPLLAIAGGGIDDKDNFEGLACRDEHHCWLVSDGDANDGTRTVLAHVTLVRK